MEVSAVAPHIPMYAESSDAQHLWDGILIKLNTFLHIWVQEEENHD